MNIWEKIDLCYDEFSPKEKAVCDLVRKEPYPFASGTSMEVSSKYGISQSSISRFCKRLGFSGYTEFRMAIASSGSMDTQNKKTGAQDTPYYEYLAGCIRLIAQSLDQNQLERTAEHMKNCRTIYCSGYGASDISASYMTFELMLGNCHAVHIPASYEVEYLHIINAQDVLVLFSASNPSHRDLFAMLKDLPKDQWPYIVLISNTRNHPFRKYADEMIVLPDQQVLNCPEFIHLSITQKDFIEIFMNTLQKQK